VAHVAPLHEPQTEERLGPGDDAAAKAVDQAIRQERAKAAEKTAAKLTANSPDKAVNKTP
jgi:hypothetical protein